MYEIISGVLPFLSSFFFWHRDMDLGFEKEKKKVQKILRRAHEHRTVISISRTSRGFPYLAVVARCGVLGLETTRHRRSMDRQRLLFPDETGLSTRAVRPWRWPLGGWWQDCRKAGAHTLHGDCLRTEMGKPERLSVCTVSVEKK
jgi:hypothetical protein